MNNDFIQYYHHDPIMAEDVNQNNPVTIIMKLDRIEMRYFFERSEMTIHGRIDTNVRLTIHTSSRCAEDEAKFQRFFAYMNHRNGVGELATRTIVMVENIIRVNGNDFYNDAYPGSVRAYSVPYRPLRQAVTFPLQEYDISSTVNLTVPPQTFPDDQIQLSLANDIIRRFNL